MSNKTLSLLYWTNIIKCSKCLVSKQVKIWSILYLRQWNICNLPGYQLVSKHENEINSLLMVFDDNIWNIYNLPEQHRLHAWWYNFLDFLTTGKVPWQLNDVHFRQRILGIELTELQLPLDRTLRDYFPSCSTLLLLLPDGAAVCHLSEGVRTKFHRSEKL